jgi:inosose dehydratase
MGGQVLNQPVVGIADIVGTLEAHGYQGWYVLEQDTVLDGEPRGAGPAEDVAASVEFLRSLA